MELFENGLRGTSSLRGSLSVLLRGTENAINGSITRVENIV